MSYRLPTTELKLPHSIEDIKFPVNRIADNATFNKKIDLIENNFLKLLEYCNVVDNNLPTMYDYNFFKDGDFLQFNDASNIITPPDHDYINIEVAERYDGNTVIICSTINRIDFYIGNIITPENLSLSFSYTQIKDVGSLTFQNITYMKIYDEKLYVYDSGLDSIIVYNILPILTNDVAILNIKFLKQFFKIGGLNGFDFTANTIYAVSSDKLIVLNKDFNVKSQHDIIQNPIDIMFDDGDLYILYNEHIDIYSSTTFNFIKKIDLLKLDTSSASLKIKKSKIDNTYYVLTDKYIYKYLSDNTFVGYFNIGTMGNKNYLDFCILEHAEYDYVFGLDQNKIHFFKNTLITFKLYDEVNLLDRADVSQQYIQDLELEQDFVYNVVLQRTLYNTFLLYNSLIFKAYIETDSHGILTYKYMENLVNNNVLERNDIFYGQNEIFSFQTFNRAFAEIYSIQEQILKLIEFGTIENTTNTLNI